jgi:uncharacterized repeat protein (TIGR03803 family)
MWHSRAFEIRRVGIVCAAVLFTATAATSQTRLETLHSFNAQGPDLPESPLLEAADGNLYGTTVRGGFANFGTIYRVARDGTAAVLHSFIGTDGSAPWGGLIQAADGALYGTASEGGASNRGVVFRMTLAGDFTVLHEFGASPDGGAPQAELVQANDGNFYSTTFSGGNFESGTIFKMTPSGVVTIVHHFSTSADGRPVAGLIQASDGSLYGTTFVGGPYAGTVFKMALDGSFTNLHSFGTNPDGSNPSATLVQASDGAIYGVTQGGGEGVGTIFRVTLGGAFSIFYRFPASASYPYAAYPYAGLIQASDGNLYGTTPYRGDITNNGCVYKLTLSGAVTVLHAFVTDGSEPFAPVIQGSDGKLYGTTIYNPASYGGGGVVFSVALDGTAAVVHAFARSSDDGANPADSVLQAMDGQFYGTTANGGPSNKGTVFRSTSSGAIVVLHSFSGGADGATPLAGVIQAADGNLYGTASDGGSGLGVIYRVATDGTFTMLHAFAGGAGDGARPMAALVQGSDGNVYGTTEHGGAADGGTIFRMAADGSVTLLHSFAGGSDGLHPRAALIEIADGHFYGTTFDGGAYGLGTIFTMTLDGTVAIVHQFAGTEGSHPTTALTDGGDGSVYGTAQSGKFISGTLFRMTSDGAVHVLHRFNGTGKYPVTAGTLLRARDGNFYGSTAEGPQATGTYVDGQIFKITPTGSFTTLYSFGGGRVGKWPQGALTQATDGDLYGVTALGGSYGAGTLFRFPFLSVTVVAPSAATVFTGTPYMIAWQADSGTAGIGAFDVMYSIDNGTSWTAITECTGLAGSARACLWNAPGPVTTAGRIKVTASDTDGNLASAMSERPFKIVSGTAFVTVTAPTSSTTKWGVGTVQQITWKHNVGTNTFFRIELSRDGGATYSEVLADAAPATSAAAGKFAWRVTAPVTNQARVRVTWLNGPAAVDASNANFVIAPPFVKITHPNGGESWTVGTAATISWTSNLGLLESVRIDLSIDGGATFPFELFPTTASDGKETVTVLSAWATTAAKIRITWLNDATVSADSKSTFTIHP